MDEHIALAFEQAAKQYGPWVSRHTINGVDYGGIADYDNDVRFADFVAMAKPAGRILEFGCFEGAHTVRLASLPGVTKVLAVDARAHLCRKTRVAVNAHNIPNVTIRTCNANDGAAIRTLGQFDQVFCSGLFYHLWEPWKFLQALRDIAPRVYLATHHAPKNMAKHEGYEGCFLREQPQYDDLSGTQEASFWPMLHDLVKMVSACGFHVESLRNYPAWKANVHDTLWPMVTLQCVRA